MTTRAPINAFELANPLYKNATVSFYTVASGVKTATLATLYSGTTGSAQLANPQKLNSRGQFKQSIYIDAPAIGEVEGISVPGHDTAIYSPAPTFRVQQSTGKLQFSYDSSSWNDSGDTIFLNRGAWVTATAYGRNDLATNSGTLYYAAEPHTSGVFATDLADGKWAEVISISSASLEFLQDGTGAVTRSIQNKEKDFISVFDFMTAAQQADVRAGTSLATAPLAAIQAAHTAAKAAGYSAVIFPSGVYSVNSGTIEWSPFVQAIALGVVTFKTSKTSGNLIHISRDFGEDLVIHPTQYNKAVFIGNFQVFGNGLTAAHTTNALFFGSLTGAGLGCQIAQINGMHISGFPSAVDYGYHSHNIEFVYSSFDYSKVRHINFGPYNGASPDSGERNSFTDCVFGNCDGEVIAVNTIHGTDWHFNCCSFDYNNSIIANVASVKTTMNFVNPHFEWSAAATQINVNGATVNITNPTFYSTNQAGTGPFISGVTTAGRLNVSGAQYILPESSPGSGVGIAETLHYASAADAVITLDYTAKHSGYVPTGLYAQGVAGAIIGYTGVHVEESSFTGTLTGCTTAPTGTVKATRVGNTVTLNIPPLTATSNTTAKTITGMPEQFRPATLARFYQSISDNGGAQVMALCTVETSGVLTITASPGAGAWTAAGVATLAGGAVSYPIN